MAFVLKPRDQPGKRIVKLLLRELDAALSALALQPFTGEAVHDIRRCGKRSRALLRLTRAALPPSDYERENGCWRAISRTLGPARDAEVMGETVAILLRRHAGSLPAATASAMQRHFASLQARALRTVGQRIARLVATLTAARERIASWRLRVGWQAVWHGFAVSWRRGRRAHRDARRHPDADHRHDWRKRAKDLVHQIRLLRRLWPDQMRAWERAWDRLGNRLGEEHDLQMLIARLPIGRDGANETRALARFAQRRAAGLQRRALRMGDRLHAERTGALLERLRRYAGNAGMA